MMLNVQRYNESVEIDKFLSIYGTQTNPSLSG